jgi:hypothetical protein
MTLKILKQSKKPYYIKLASFPYRKNDILCYHPTAKVVVLNPRCKDQWWRKLLRKFGFKIFNPTDCIKVKPICENLK